MKKFIQIIAVVILALLFTSCRSKKIDKSVTDIEVEKASDSTSVQKTTTTAANETKQEVATENNIVESKNNLILIPINKELPIDIISNKGEKTSVYNASIEINNEKKVDKTKTNLIKDSKDNNQKIKEKKVTAVKKETQQIKQKIVKKDIKSNWFFILLPYIISLLIFIILLLIWIFRKKIPYLKNLFI